MDEEVMIEAMNKSGNPSSVEITFEDLATFGKKRKRILDTSEHIVLKKQKTQEKQSPGLPLFSRTCPRLHLEFKFIQIELGSAKKDNNGNINKYHKRMTTSDKAKVNMLKVLGFSSSRYPVLICFLDAPFFLTRLSSCFSM
jgi:hypothetical protein